jgi:hypothetical protein
VTTSRLLRGNKGAEAATVDALETSETHTLTDGERVACMLGVEDVLKWSELAEVDEDALVALPFS